MLNRPLTRTTESSRSERRVTLVSGASAEPRHGLSVFGDLKYPPDFSHFDYVNPEAPKGGEIALSVSGTFNSMFNSLRRISTSEAAAIIPRKIDVVTVGRGDTVQSLANRMAYDNGKVERFRVLNALGANDTLTPGQKVKIVVRGS